MIILNGDKDYIVALNDLLQKYGFETCILKERLKKDSLYFSTDDIQNIIIAVLGGGSFATVLTSYFKHSKKIFDMKRSKDGDLEIEIRNIKPDEFSRYLNELKLHLDSAGDSHHTT